MNENRQEIWDKYIGPINRNIKRMFLDYDRYFEAEAIEDALESMHQDISKMVVLDYGCGVADYGIYFGRLGSRVCIYDTDLEALDFALYRFRLEDKRVELCKSIIGHDLVIFGEVLDHLENPLAVVKAAIDTKTRFIFTSSYPYRSEDPQEPHWQHDHHPKTALEQQPEIREILEKNYNKINFGGQRNLWTRK